MKKINSNNIIEIWPAVSKMLSVPHTHKDYDKLVKLMDNLIDSIGNNEHHPLATLMETVGILIEKYEEEHHPMPKTSGVEALKYLMEEHGLKQADLRDIGSQGVVSEILNGKRELNVRQIKFLAEKFSVSPEVFI
jgi:HTH-type transcriptional regulator / antitoxin HigA